MRGATDAPVDFATGVLNAVLLAATFIGVLWAVGGSLSINVGGVGITIPGFLVMAAVLYTVMASGPMIFIGRRLVNVSERKNQAEAEYRYVLTRCARTARASRCWGRAEERRAIDRSLTAVLRRWRDLCIQTMRTTVVSQTSSYVVPVLPIILCAPKFLDGSMTLGEVMQAVSAFTIVQSAFNWLVDNYPRLADWAAAASRVASLMSSLDALERRKAPRRRPHRARQDRGRGATAARPVGHARRRHRGGQGDGGGDRAGRAGAGRGRVRHRQEHAGARDFRPVAVGRRQRAGAGRRQDPADAAAPLRAARHVAAGGHLPGVAG